MKFPFSWARPAPRPDLPAVLQVFGEPRWLTDGEVLALAFAVDGSLWSVDEAGVLQHWTADGRPLSRVRLSDLETLWAFGPAATRLASASDDVCLWEPSNGKRLKVLEQISWVTALAFHPTRPLLATGHEDCRIIVWNVETGREEASCKPHRMPVSALAFRPDGAWLASAGEDRVIRLWNLSADSASLELVGHTDRIPQLTWHRQNGSWFLISAGWDTTARVWNVESGEPVMLLNTHSEQVHVVASSTSGLVATADSEQAIFLWANPVAGNVATILHGGQGEIRSLHFSPDGRRLASAGADRVIRLWDTQSGEMLGGQSTMRHAIVLGGSAKSPRLVSNAGGLELTLWTANGERQTLPVAAGAITTSADGRWLAAGQGDGRIHLYDLQALSQPPIELVGQRGAVTDLAVASNGQLLASASGSEGTVWLWDVTRREPVLLIPEAADGCTVEAVAFLPDGRRLLCGGIDFLATRDRDGATCLWDVTAQDLIEVFDGGLLALAIDPHGETWAAAAPDGALLLGPLVDAPAKELTGEGARIRAVAFSPDGKWLVSGDDDGILSVWRADSGDAVHRSELLSPIQSLVFSHDGQSLYAGLANCACFRLDIKRLTTPPH